MYLDQISFEYTTVFVLLTPVARKTSPRHEAIISPLDRFRSVCHDIKTEEGKKTSQTPIVSIMVPQRGGRMT